MNIVWIAVVAALSNQAADPATASCGASFAELARSVEDNYAGHAIEVARVPARLADYERHRAAYEAKAAADQAGCIAVLRGFADWFDDPHLFVNEAPEHSAEALARFAGSVGKANARAAREAAAQPGADPIVGLWMAAGEEVAIVPRGDGFIAVQLADSKTVKSGEIAGQFIADGKGGYAATLLAEDKSPRRYRAAIQKNMLLHMAPLTWGRITPLTERDAKLIDPANPRSAAFAALDDRTALLSLPSFSGEHGKPLQALIEANKTAITGSDLLILDLRGNEGGTSLFTQLLEPFYHAEPMAPMTQRGDDGFVLSSPKIIAYFERMRDGIPDGAPYRAIVADLALRLRAQPGALIPFVADPKLRLPESPPLPAAAGPKQVAMLIDRHSVSAAEAVVLHARRSPKVKLFGENSGGSIDYQNVMVTGIGAGAYKYHFGLPTIASSDRLPEGGFNREGIPVDVRLDMDGRDPIDAIRAYYSQIETALTVGGASPALLGAGGVLGGRGRAGPLRAPAGEQHGFGEMAPGDLLP